jgi:hypothetical protein
MVSFNGLTSIFKAAPEAAKVAQPAAKSLQGVKSAQPLAKVSDDASKEVAKKTSVPTKVAIGAGVLGGVALLSSGASGAIGGGCEKLMGVNNCQFVTAPEQAISRLTGLPAQLAEGVVFVAAGAFVIGTTLLAHNMVGNGWLTAGTFTTSTLIAVGIVNRED